jgi:hypothetical protein
MAGWVGSETAFTGLGANSATQKPFAAKHFRHGRQEFATRVGLEHIATTSVAHSGLDYIWTGPFWLLRQELRGIEPPPESREVLREQRTPDVPAIAKFL